MFKLIVYFRAHKINEIRDDVLVNNFIISKKSVQSQKYIKNSSLFSSLRFIILFKIFFGTVSSIFYLKCRLQFYVLYFLGSDFTVMNLLGYPAQS